MKRRPKDYLTDENIVKIEEFLENWKEGAVFSKMIAIEEVAKNDNNLSPSHYMAVGMRARSSSCFPCMDI